ncbi:MAG TPA: hypothetical protein PLV91_01705 [Verrucomicrobiota bacterium]|jgi:hypothetical protein|nr:hypothetical protein [Verrucomicrobiota bacterium]
MQNRFIVSLMAVALALGVSLPAGAEETTEVLFEDAFLGDTLSKSWEMDNRSFEYKKYPQAAGVLDTFVMDRTASLDFTTEEAAWAGGAYLRAVGFSFGERQTLTFSIERDFMAVPERCFGARSTLFFQEDVQEGSPERWVRFSDNLEEKTHTGWGYHRLIDKPGDNPEGAAVLFPDFQTDDFLNYGSHRIQCVANGVTLAFFIDGVYGGEVDFPVKEDIQFGFGVYADQPGDMVYAGFKNVRVTRTQLDPGVPLILRQPASLTAMETTEATFSVLSEEAKSFQWYHNDEPIEGAMLPVLTLNNISPADAGSYWVRVSNDLGEAESRRATLTVVPFVIGEAELSFTVENGELVLTFTGSLQESNDCKEWSGKLPVTSPYRVNLSGARKFFRATL